MRGELDKTESLPPKTGKVDAGIFARGDFTEADVGAFVDVEKRLNDRLALFGRAEGFVTLGSEQRDYGWSALGGLRLRF